MRIMHLCLDSPYNDYWGYQDNLLPKYQKAAGNDVVVVTTNLMQENGKKVETETGRYELSDGQTIIRIKGNPKGILQFKRVVIKYDILPLLKEFKPDIVFQHGVINISIFQVIQYVKKVNPNCVVFQDNHLDYDIGMNVVGVKSHVLRSYYRWLNRRTVNRVDKIYGVTPWRVQYLQEYFGIPINKTDLLVMGADDDQVDYINRDKIRKQVRIKYGVEEKDFLIVSGGKIDAKKKIDVLVNAFTKINKHDAKLLIFGNATKESQELLEQYENDKGIIFTGWVDSAYTYQLFLAADLIVYPGKHSVLWEQSVACKVPCIFKDWPGMHHVDIGGNAVFIKEDSELLAVLKRIFDEPNFYSVLLECARKPEAEQFLYSNIAKKTIEDARRVQVERE